MNSESKYLNILSIFHYIVAGIAGLFFCFPIIHLIIGISTLAGGFFTEGTPPGSSLPLTFGLLFTIIPAAIILLGWTFAICLAVAGYFLSKRRHYYFCMVMAGIACTFTPFGTVLGIFTIILLVQPAVRQMFGQS